MQVFMVPSWLPNVCLPFEKIEMLMEDVVPQLRQYSMNIILGIFTAALFCPFGLAQAQTRYLI